MIERIAECRPAYETAINGTLTFLRADARATVTTRRIAIVTLLAPLFRSITTDGKTHTATSGISTTGTTA
jgi:hypothetical protein